MNRKGAKHCKDCGEPLAAATGLVCPSCGHKNPKGAKFCDDCGADLSTTPPPNSKPRRLTEEPSTTPPVVVEVRKEEKRRLNPLWLVVILLLLLLLLICGCGGLLLFGKVEVPEFVAPYVESYIEPYLEDMRESYRGFIDRSQPDEDVGKGGPPKDKDIDCEDFRDDLEKVKRGGTMDDPQDPNKWVMDVIDIGNLKDLELFYQWEGGEKARADCKDKGDFLRCSFPNPPGLQTEIKFWIALDDCEDELGFIKWDEEGDITDHIFQLAPSSASCCPELEVTYTGYYNPKVLRLLEIDLTCEDSAWNIDEGDILNGEVFIGEGQVDLWTEVSCELSDDVLHCVSPGTVDQKVSWCKLDVVGDNCSSEAYFQCPYYEQYEPPDEPKVQPTEESSGSY